MSHKRITIRLSEDEYKTIQSRAAAVHVSVSEIVRALAVSGGNPGSGSEQITEALSEVFAGLSSRLDAIETTGGARDTSAIEQQIAQLTASQSRTERALSSLIDAVEKLQTAQGYRAPSAPQSAPAAASPAPSFYSWRDSQGKPEPGESIPQFTARMKQKYRETFGVDAL